MNKKAICIAILYVMFFVFLVPHLVFGSREEQTVTKVISPIEFILDKSNNCKLNGISIFDADYTENNKTLAQKLEITEDEAFILGNLGKYWSKNLLEGRKIKPKNNDLVYYKFGYLTRLKNSPFAIINGKPSNKQSFNRELNSIRKGKFVIIDVDTDASFPISKANRQKVNRFVIVRKSHVKNILPKTTGIAVTDVLYNPIYKSSNIKIIVSDLTTKTMPDRNCSSEICKEILRNINTASESIDIAIYGYSSTPAIEKAIEKALARGVKIRLVYDSDSKGNNIYPDTAKFVKLIPDNKSDINSAEANNTMHNKFYIFDKKIVITGSANLSHTDMSGYNSNSVIVIYSPKIAEIYLQEFEQMYNGKFHNNKISFSNTTDNNISIWFSPQDKGITKAIIPLIKNAKKYIYIPAFVITEKRMAAELINAKNRGVDVKIIADALNASTQHSKHKELRSAGIEVKAENYAGKMHSKTMIIDDEYLIIGSMNFSNSGENRNDENMVVLKDTNAARFYRNFFLYEWSRIPDRWLKFTPRAESFDSIGSCTDGLDNNYDGKTDKEDIGCKK